MSNEWMINGTILSMFGVALFNLFDALITLVGRNMGISEGNPLLRGLVEHQPVIFLLGKIVITGLLFYVINRAYIERAILVKNPLLLGVTLLITTAVFIMYVVVVTDNIRIISGGLRI